MLHTICCVTRWNHTGVYLILYLVEHVFYYLFKLLFQLEYGFHVNRENSFAWLEIILVPFIGIVWKKKTLIAKQGSQKYKLNQLASNNSMYFPMSIAELPSICLEQWCASIHKQNAWAQSMNLRELQYIGRWDLYRVSQEEM
jgi:hypothetical protein